MAKELPPQSRWFMWLEDLRRDVIYGVRALLRTTSFTLVAVLTLALGISAVTVIYSVLRNVALDPFPYSRSDRLVNVVLRDGSGRIIRGCRCRRSSCRSRSAPAGSCSRSARPTSRRGSRLPLSASFTRSIRASPSSSRPLSKRCSTGCSLRGHASACWCWASSPAPASCWSRWACTVCLPTPSTQTREIAIRLALGGDRGHVVRMVLKLGMRMVAVGLIIGVAVSIATNRLLQSELWGTTPTDPMTFAAGILVTSRSVPSRVCTCAARGADQRWSPCGTSKCTRQRCVGSLTLVRISGLAAGA